MNTIRKAIIILLVLTFVFVSSGLTPVKAGTIDNAIGMADFVISNKQFSISNLVNPNVIVQFNKIINLSDGLKGEMVLNGNSVFLHVWKPNSGKRDVYQWDSSKSAWQYKYSIVNIVKGFEAPTTVQNSKYATWSDYVHFIENYNGAGNNITPVGNGISVSLSGPTKLQVNAVGEYTASISGGTRPYTLIWSTSGYMSSSGYAAKYKWNKGGQYKVVLVVKDVNGKTGRASLDVTVESWKIKFDMPASAVWYGIPQMAYYRNGAVLYNFGRIKNIRSLPQNSPYVIYIDDGGSDTDKFQLVSVIAKNQYHDSTNCTDLFHGSIAFNPPNGVRHWWLFYAGDFDGIPMVFGDVTFDVKVKDTTTGKVKEAKHTVHIDFALPLEPNVWAYWDNYEAETTTLHSYPIAVVKESPNGKTTVYVKWITTDHYYATDEALIEAYHGGNSELTSEVNQFVSNPDAFADKKADGGDGMADGVGGALDSLLGMDNLEGLFSVLDKSPGSNLGGHATQIHSDGSTSPVSQSSTMTTYIIHQYNGAMIQLSNGNPLFTILEEWRYRQGEILTAGAEPQFIYSNVSKDASRFPVYFDVDPYNTVAVNINSLSIPYLILSTPGNISLKEIAYTHFTLEKGSINMHLSGAYNYKYLGNEQVQIVSKILAPIHKMTVTWLDGTIDTNNSTYNTFLSLFNNNTLEYIEGSNVIRGIEATPSSLDFTTKDPQYVSIEYYKDDGSHVSPTGEQAGILTGGNDGSIIAVWIRKGYGLKVIPIQKGSGTISFSKDDLGGPYGIDIPVTVEKDFADFSITVNGNGLNNLKDNGWLSPQSIVNTQYYGEYMSYEYGIYYKTVWFPWVSWQYVTGLTDGGSANSYGQVTPSWYNTFTESNEDNACEDLAHNQYDLNVKITASSNVKVRFTVQYGNTSPIVLNVSGNTVEKDLTAPNSWVVHNLEDAYKDAVYYNDEDGIDQSVTYKVEVSVNGDTWTTIKTGSDILHFEYDYHLG